MTELSSLLLAGFFFIMGAAVIGVIWYMQSVASGKLRLGKKAEEPDSNLAEVARLMRDKTTQDLVVTMNGHTIHHAIELNPGQSRRLHFASRVLEKWLAEGPPPPPANGHGEGELADAEGGMAEPVSVAAPSRQAAPVSPASDEDWIPAETASLNTQLETIPAFMAEPAGEVKPVSTSFADVVGGMLKPASSNTAPAFKSIAMQIDEILQEMIAGTPFEQRGITVNDAPDQGVMVTLDGQKYLGVKDVPDEEVRNLIRSAVVEWEKTGKFNSH